MHVYPVEDVFHEFAPYFAEQVRKDVVDRYGNPALLNEGLKVFTTMDAEKQRAAQDSDAGRPAGGGQAPGLPRARCMHLGGEAEVKAFIEKSRKVMGEEKIEKGKLYVAVVTGINADGTEADVQVGAKKGKLPVLGMRWARQVNPEAYYPSAMVGSVKKALTVGDVVVVRAVEQKDLADDKEQFDKKLNDEGAAGRAALPAGAGAGAAGRAGVH